MRVSDPELKIFPDAFGKAMVHLAETTWADVFFGEELRTIIEFN